MARVSAGSLKKSTRGSPTSDHEQLIQNYMQDGFSKFGFTLFLKVSILNTVSDYKVDLKSFYDSIKTMQTKDVFNCRLKRLINKQIKHVRSKVPPAHEICYFCDDEVNGCGECLEDNLIYSGECDSYSVVDFLSLFSREFSVVPDAWRINSAGWFEIIEVKDSSEVSFKKLIKLARIDDLLYSNFGNDIRLDVYEHYIDSDSIVRHDLALAFDMVELWLPYVSKSNNDRQMLRDYRKKLSLIGESADTGSLPSVSLTINQ